MRIRAPNSSGVVGGGKFPTKQKTDQVAQSFIQLGLQQPQLPQAVFTAEVLRPSEHPHGPSLDLL